MQVSVEAGVYKMTLIDSMDFGSKSAEGPSWDKFGQFIQWWSRQNPFPPEKYGNDSLPSLMPENDTLIITTVGGRGSNSSLYKQAEREAECGCNETFSSDMTHTGSQCTPALAFVGKVTVELSHFASSRKMLTVSATRQNVDVSANYARGLGRESTVYRVIPRVSQDAVALIRYVKSQGWTDCSFIVNYAHESAMFFLEAGRREAASLDIQIVASGGYTSDPNFNAGTLDGGDYILNQIKRTGKHVIILFNQHYLPIEILRKADQLGMIGNGYVWLGSFDPAAFGPRLLMEAKEDPSIKHLVDGMIAVTTFSPRSGPMEPCKTIGERIESNAMINMPEGSKKNDTLMFAKLMQMYGGYFCAYALMEVSKNASGVSPDKEEYFSIDHLNLSLIIKISCQSDNYMDNFLALEALYSTALAIGRMAAKVNECRKSRSSQQLCRMLETLEGQREVVIQEYENNSFNLFLSNSTPNIYREPDMYPWLYNIRAKYADEATGDKLGQRRMPWRPVGTLSKSGMFIPIPNEITYFHGDSILVPPNDAGLPMEERNYIPKNFSILGVVLFLVVLLLACGMICWICAVRDRVMVKASQPLLMIQIAIGCCVSSSGMVAQGMDDRFLSPRVLGVLCNWRIWVYGIGFAITHTALLMKLWVVKVTILDFNKDKEYKTVRYPRMISKILGCTIWSRASNKCTKVWYLPKIVGVGVEAFFLSVWNAVDGFKRIPN